MTYQQADELRTKHTKLTGETVEFSPTPFYVRHLLIAPVASSSSDILKILNENIYKPIDNETALRNLKLLHKNLAVFLVGAETKGQREGETVQTMDLEVYLEKSSTLSS